LGGAKHSAAAAEQLQLYVTPDVSLTCPGEPCATLSHYITSWDNYLHDDGANTSIALLFMKGIHIAPHGSRLLTETSSLTMKGSKSEVFFLNLTMNSSVTLNVANLTFYESELRFFSADLEVPLTFEITSTRLYNISRLIIVSPFAIGCIEDTVFSLGTQVYLIEASEVKLIRCVSHGTVTAAPVDNITIEDSKFQTNGFTAYNSKIYLVGTSFFMNNENSALVAYYSTVALAGNITFRDNYGTRGGALALYSSTITIANGTNISFISNSVRDTGGAIHVEPFMGRNGILAQPFVRRSCFYQLLDCASGGEYSISFLNNSAPIGGNDIYGASLMDNCYVDGGDGGYCTSFNVMNFFHFGNSSTSSISSSPTRVCVCDSVDQPQCSNISYIFLERTIYPGETFTLPVAIVGGDFGQTIGVVYTGFLPSNSSQTSSSSLHPSTQHNQMIDNSSTCGRVSFTLYSADEAVTLYLRASFGLVSEDAYDKLRLEQQITNFETNGFIQYDLLNTPVFVNVSLLPCPPGFALLGAGDGDLPGCDCYPVLSANGVKCDIINGTGYMHIPWNNTMWVATHENGIIYGQLCPPSYCDGTNKWFNVESDPDTQCAFNHAGQLCGGCKDGYSLALGSSNCVKCSNNNNLSLLLFFAAAGPMLVLLISVLNLTVTQGMINGLIFYANIVWAYQSILIPEREIGYLKFLSVFIAWLNLDFGIQACFFNGLTAFWRNWLQYLFPIYTAALFFLGVRFSSKLSKLFGSRSVPTLATLLFLSYAKLLRIIITAMKLTDLTTYPENRTISVWAVDGNLVYGHFPHIFLLLVALACLVFLWAPYTFILFLMQWLRRVDHHRPLRQLAKYKPVYDAYFAPLKDRHHYWFGALLLSQGALLLVSSLTLQTVPAVGILVLLGVLMLLLSYMNCMQVYKRKLVFILESSFLINLILLVCGTLYYKYNEDARVVVTCICLTFALVKFCGIIAWEFLLMLHERVRLNELQIRWSKSLDAVVVSNHRDSEHSTASEGESISSDYHPSPQRLECRFRDSILEEDTVDVKQASTY
jgi:predicted outer membrane repeat protein